MIDFTVTIDRSTSPSSITYAPVFNLAVPMIDRHLDEGRGAKVAIRTVDQEVTYAELAESVNRCGNALLGQGLTPGQRMLMIVKDCPEFIFLFYGAIKAGIVPVPLNTLLRASDYQYMMEDSGAAGLVFSSEYAGEVEAALDASANKPSMVVATDGEDGFLHHPDDIEGQCDSIGRIFLNQGLLKGLGVRARLKVESNFNIEELVLRNINLYSKVLNS